MTYKKPVKDKQCVFYKIRPEIKSLVLLNYDEQGNSCSEKINLPAIIFYSVLPVAPNYLLDILDTKQNKDGLVKVKIYIPLTNRDMKYLERKVIGWVPPSAITLHFTNEVFDGRFNLSKKKGNYNVQRNKI